MLTPFDTYYDAVDFAVDSNWFTATFNERVTWEIKIKGLQSKAEKTVKGTSSELNKQTAYWSGTHSGLYFFKAGEQVVAELSIFGLKEKWVDTSTIVGEKISYGPNVVVLWDMNQIGVARHGIECYWFDYYDGNCTTYPTPGCERMEDLLLNAYTDGGIQGIYRGMEGKDGIGPSNYYIGGMGHTNILLNMGANVPLNQLYLNFYVRRRTLTSGLGGSLNATNTTTPDLSTLSFDLGRITWEGWKLVSINFSSMKVETPSLPAFRTDRIAAFRLYPQITDNAGVDQSGFDIDFITITKGAPFNPANYR
jgi:hypothetical protein